MLKRLVAVGRLGKSDRVLDVGCGVGRVAVPLTGFLNERGSYEGFDVVEPEICWCRKNITPRFPRFRFYVADVYNREYNPSGRAASAAEYVFPFDDGEFDFVFLTSVFTHMLPEEIENYVSEISRVLKPGGRCFATFFLLNEESLALLEAGKSSLPLPHDLGEYRVKDESTPETAIAFPEEYVSNLLACEKLIPEQTRYGSWCGRRDFLDYQDIVISVKDELCTKREDGTSWDE